MTRALKIQILRYLASMWAAGVSSGAHAAVAFFSVAGAHAVADSVPALSLQQLAAVFLLAQGKAMLVYLDAHPISFSLREGHQLREDENQPQPPATPAQPSQDTHEK